MRLVGPFWLLVVLAVGPWLLAAQQEAKSPSPDVSPRAPTEDSVDSEANQAPVIGDESLSGALEIINRILDADQEAQRGGALGYDAGSRRDPFRSLLVNPDRPSARGPRPAGVPGLLIANLTVKGIFVTPKGAIAQVRVSNKTAHYILREGDQLFDGEVVSIRFVKNKVAEVVFRQGVEDPAAIKPFREVVKKLRR